MPLLKNTQNHTPLQRKPKKEYLDTEDLAEQGFGYDVVLHQSINVQYLLSHCGLDYNRASKDKSSNNEGNLIIDIIL